MHTVWTFWIKYKITAGKTREMNFMKKNFSFNIETFVDAWTNQRLFPCSYSFRQIRGRYWRYQEDSSGQHEFLLLLPGGTIYFHRFLPVHRDYVCARVCVIGSVPTYDLFRDSPDDDSGPSSPTSWLTRMSKRPCTYRRASAAAIGIGLTFPGIDYRMPRWPILITSPWTIVWAYNWTNNIDWMSKIGGLSLVWANCCYGCWTRKRTITVSRYTNELYQRKIHEFLWRNRQAWYLCDPTKSWNESNVRIVS